VKYVALLAFNRIVELHPNLVSMHEDVVMECLDDADISIRLRALDLVVGMVNANNLTSIVDRLMSQLRSTPVSSRADDPLNDRGFSAGVEPAADSDDEDAEQSITPAERGSKQPPPLPDEYRTNIIQRTLEMCSRNTYGNINDFDWYIDTLVQLVKHTAPPSATSVETTSAQVRDSIHDTGDVGHAMGNELRNVAVRVKSSRMEATRAAELLLSIDRRDQLFPRSHSGSQGVLEPSAWIAGEYADVLQNPDGTLTSLLNFPTSQLPPRTLSVFIQAIVKVLTSCIGSSQQAWTPERKTVVSLLIAKVTHYLEPLATHPSLEVQERAVEFLELTRLASEAVAVHKPGSDYSEFVPPPLFLTEAMPALFTGMELKPVARDAQRKVPLPGNLDLDNAINKNLFQILNIAESEVLDGVDNDFEEYYHQRRQARNVIEPAANRLQNTEPEFSYQQSGQALLDPETLARKRAERRERYKDDPFYIPSDDNSGNSTPLGNILRSNNGEALDVESIPIMELDLEHNDTETRLPAAAKTDANKRKPRRHFEILADESIEDGEISSSDNSVTRQGRGKRSLLQVDSSGLGSLSLEGSAIENQFDVERREAEEAEMAVAMREVERLRLEMQRASETIEAKHGPPEGVVVKTKKKKKMVSVMEASELEADVGQEPAAEKVPKKKKKKSKEVAPPPDDEAGVDVMVPKKKKKRRQVTFEE